RGLARHLFLGAEQRAFDSLSVSKKSLTIFRQGISGSFGFVEQDGVQRLFKQMDTPRHCGVAHAQPEGCRAYPLRSGYFNKVADAVPIHVVHISTLNVHVFLWNLVFYTTKLDEEQRHP